MYARLCFVVLLLFAAAPKLPAQNPGDNLFGAAAVHEIRITFTQSSYWDSLLLYKAQNDTAASYHYMPGLVVLDGDTLDSTGIRLKGNSSYAHPGQKKPLVLNFNEFIPGQKADGLKALHLNNSAYDPTMLREKLFLDEINRFGLPAPRCAFTTLYYNNVYIGLYKMVESVDKTFLQTRFGNDERNLFKGDPETPLVWEGNAQSYYYDNFQLKTNETANNWTDLVHLLDVINNSGSNFHMQLAATFNVDDYIKIWALNNVYGNLDSYMYYPHNFYLYNDSLAGRFQWISWDVGVVFGVIPTGFTAQSEFDLLYLPDPPESRPLNNNLLNDSVYKAMYMNAVCYYINNGLLPARLFPKIDSLAAVIRPYVYAEDPANQMYTPAQFESNLGYGEQPSFLVYKIPGLKSFIAQRRGKVTGQLCDKKWSCLTGGSIAGLPPDELIRVFPNPANDVVTVEYASPQADVAIYYELRDVTGRLLLKENTVLPAGDFRRVLPLQRYKPGVYYLRILAGCDFTEKKIVITR
jgi:hypothetical protein